LKRLRKTFLTVLKSDAIKQQAIIAITTETIVVGICFAVFKIPESGVARLEISKFVVGASGEFEEFKNSLSFSLINEVIVLSTLSGKKERPSLKANSIFTRRVGISYKRSSK
jgi:hypothetical protein